MPKLIKIDLPKKTIMVEGKEQPEKLKSTKRKRGYLVLGKKDTDIC